MTNKDKDVVIAPVGATIPTITSILQNSVPTGAVYAGGLPAGSAISKKPCYLLSIELKPKATYYFIALDKPVHENYFIQVKGFYSELGEEDIIKQFLDIIQNTPKDRYMEISFPAHKVNYIRSLVFNAVKAASFSKEVR